MNRIKLCGIIAIIILLGILYLNRRFGFGRGLILYFLGIPFLILGVYLFPATMWRTIAIGAVIIGVLLELAAIVLTVRKVRKREK